MILSGILENVLNLEGIYFSVVYSFLLVAIIIRVKLDCSKISEGYKKHIIPIIIFPVIFTFLWLIVWPGTLRLFLRGKRLEDTIAGKLTIRQNKSLTKRSRATRYRSTVKT
ncbi:MAG: hypothetical protein L3J39_04630 [Verrucomicrobiales bacterium]|nr:hypothetical protein [Verrucomicrobiales bacterium]